MICLAHALGLACLFMSTFGAWLHVLLSDLDLCALQVGDHDGHVFGLHIIWMILDCMFDLFGLHEFDLQDLHAF